LNISLESALSKKMNVDLVQGPRGATAEFNVTVPASRNPGGQYEDGAFGNAANAGLGRKKGIYSMGARKVISTKE
jgi:hypothetical protein